MSFINFNAPLQKAGAKSTLSSRVWKQVISVHGSKNLYFCEFRAGETELGNMKNDADRRDYVLNLLAEEGVYNAMERFAGSLSVSFKRGKITIWVVEDLFNELGLVEFKKAGELKSKASGLPMCDVYTSGAQANIVDATKGVFGRSK